MGQPDRAEVLAQLVVEPAGVADDQPGQQPALGLGERVDRAPQPGPEVTGGPLHERGTVQDDGRSASGQHRGDVVTALGRAQPALDPHADAGQQRQPPLLGRQQHHGRAQAVDPSGRAELDHPQPRHHEVRARTGAADHPPCIVGEHGLHGDGGLGRSGLGERPRGARSRVDTRDQCRGCGAADRRGQDEATSVRPADQQDAGDDHRDEPGEQQQP